MSGSQVVIVVVAAGSGLRFGADKLNAPLGERTVLEHALAAVRGPFPAAPVALVVRPERVAEVAELPLAAGVKVVAGGRRRQDSVRSGVEALAPPDDTLVMIHDGARPFVPAEDVRRVVEEAARSSAALLAAPMVDTVKRIRHDGTVDSTIPREQLARALTPQVFRAGLLRRAWSDAGDAEWSDEASLIERLGGPVVAVPGDARNVKITQPNDLDAFGRLQAASPRVGQGVDVHPFAAGRKLWLCGVEVPGELGLAGHSDADVALHAVTDAVLGACGAGDIGEHFPPSDERWRDARSDLFVARAVEIAAELQWRPASCDVTLLAERPRIAPFRDAMRTRLAELLALPLDRVSLKATTCEGLGFVGRNEGIVALALVTLEQR
jgi:2-C-methyl-D-erythritol 4-phosphate cytidylyltransferase/2-C-methyl-D-erythritol 2,4-cyclodiphosphate synthase